MNTSFGIMPYATAAEYDLPVATRANVDLNNITKAKIKKLNSDSVYANTLSQLTLENFSKAVEVIEPALWIIGNEEDVRTTNFEDYKMQLLIANSIAPNKFTNGGLTQIKLWYYYQTYSTNKDIDFFNNNLTSYQKNILLHIAPDVITTYCEYIDFLKTIEGLLSINIHGLYVSDVKELPGLQRMIAFLKNYVGKSVCTTECGWYKQDQNILNGLAQLAKDEEMPVMIFYNGYGKPALPISQEQYFTAINSIK